MERVSSKISEGWGDSKVGRASISFWELMFKTRTCFIWEEVSVSSWLWSIKPKYSRLCLWIASMLRRTFSLPIPYWRSSSSFYTPMSLKEGTPLYSHVELPEVGQVLPKWGRSKNRESIRVVRKKSKSLDLDRSSCCSAKRRIWSILRTVTVPKEAALSKYWIFSLFTTYQGVSRISIPVSSEKLVNEPVLVEFWRGREEHWEACPSIVLGNKPKPSFIQEYYDENLLLGSEESGEYGGLELSEREEELVLLRESRFRLVWNFGGLGLHSILIL